MPISRRSSARPRSWACLLGVHGAPSRGFGFDFFEDQGQVHALEHPFPLMIQFTSIICDGVLERFPKLKIAFLEAGCGWLPYMMDRLDYEYETRGARSFPNMKKKPSDYVKDCPVYVSCEPEEHFPRLCQPSDRRRSHHVSLRLSP